MVCPYCGIRVESDWRFCPHCEKALPEHREKAVQAPRREAEKTGRPKRAAQTGQATEMARTVPPVGLDNPAAKPREASPVRRGHPSLGLVFAILLGLIALALGAFFLPPIIGDILLPSVFAADGSWPLRDRPTHSLVVSADGKAVAYVAATASGEEYLVVKRGERIFTGKAYPAITGLALSADASHWAYIALKDPAKAAGQDGGAGLLVRDEVEGPAWDYLGSLRLSRNGRVLACVAASGGTWAEAASRGLRYGGGTWTVLVDGKPGDSYDHVDFLSMSEDGRHIAFAASRGLAWGYLPDEGWSYSGGRATVVSDGLASRGYDLVRALALSRDGKRMVFVASQGGEWLSAGHGGGYAGGTSLVSAGPGAEMEYDWLGGLAADKDLSSWGIVAGRGGEWSRTAKGGLSYGGGTFYVLGPKGEGEAWDEVASFQASADGRNLLYAGGKGGEWRKDEEGNWHYGKGSWTIVAGGRRLDLAFKPASLSLSPDGRHFAYYYPIRIERFDDKDLAWWYTPADRPLRLVLDGTTLDGDYAGISELSLDDRGLSAKVRLDPMAAEEPKVISFEEGPSEPPKGLASAIIPSPDGQKGLWIASEGSGWRLVVGPLGR
jgi:hypothetical protein